MDADDGDNRTNLTKLSVKLTDLAANRETEKLRVRLKRG